MFYRILRENTNTPAMTCHGAEKKETKNQVSVKQKMGRIWRIRILVPEQIMWLKNKNDYRFGGAETLSVFDLIYHQIRWVVKKIFQIRIK